MQKLKQPVGKDTNGKVMSVRDLIDKSKKNLYGLLGKSLSVQGYVSSGTVNDYWEPSSVLFNLMQSNHSPFLPISEENDPSSVFCCLSKKGLEKYIALQKGRNSTKEESPSVTVNGSRVKVTGSIAEFGGEALVKVDDFELYDGPAT